MEEVITVNGITYKQLMNKCGRSNCTKCTQEDGHGPYWYAFGEGYSRKYIGKALPAAITEHLKMLEADKEKLEELRDQLNDQKNQLYREYRQAEDEERSIVMLLSGGYVKAQTLELLGLGKFVVNGHKS